MKDLVGQTLGQYRIEASLGSGSMGEVFRGKHMRLNQPAAIKVIHNYIATNPTFRTRFLQEAKSIAALRHPHIVEVHEFGEQDGLLYLIMEQMMDGALSALLLQRAVKRFEALIVGLDLVRQAAEGLEAAHALGKIHRDIKPDNLLLNRLSSAERGGEQYQLKISEFGLASLNESSGLTRGNPVGTPAYMSPEQCQEKTLDGRSDLYSLGVVLYEVVTGYLPFQINSFGDAMQKHVNAAPLQPRQVRPDLPPFVEQIILRCLAKRPEERYQTGKELARALQEAINHASLQTMAPLVPLSPLVISSPKPPSVRILDLGGQTIQVAEVTREGLIIGRQKDCDMVLSAETISRRHLQVKWDGRQTTITDLKSSYGTKLGNEKLTPQVSRVWEETQTVSIDPFLLHLEAPKVSEVPIKAEQEKPVLHSDPLPQGPPSLAASNRIGVRAEPERLTITPGQPTGVKITLVNLGKTVDWFTPIVEGVTQEWVQGQGQEARLNPGMQESVQLRINVSKTVENRAQEYPVTIRVTSREKPWESGSVQAIWTVLPFWEDNLKIEPEKASGRGTGNYIVTVRNNGNAPGRYELSGEDAEEKLAYHFQPHNEVRVEPGKQARIPLQVKTHRFWLGKGRPQPFQIHATPAVKRSPQTKNAELVNKALIPNWLLVVAFAVLMVALIPIILLAANRPAAAPTPTPTPIILVGTPTPTATPVTQGPIISYSPNFANSSNLQLNGAATIVPSSSVLELTHAQTDKPGSAYDKRQIDPNQSFQTQFQFWLHDGTNPPADGISFIIQNSNASSQAFGNGPQSVVITFATFPNNHISVELNGVSLPPLQGQVNQPPNLYGNVIDAHINYDASSKLLQVSVNPVNTPQSPLFTISVDIAGAVGSSAFVGFTGGTGQSAAAQDILNWQFFGKFLSATTQSRNDHAEASK